MKLSKHSVIVIFIAILLGLAIFSLWSLNKSYLYKTQISLLNQTQEELKQRQKLELRQEAGQENMEHISVATNNDGTMEAFFRVDHDKNRLVFNVSINQPPTISGDTDPVIQIDRTEDGGLWEGDAMANKTVILEGTSAVFSPDGTKLALKAPDQTIYIWEITENIQDQPKESSWKRKILLKEFKKIQTIPRLGGLAYDEKQKYGGGNILFSGDSKELYGYFNLDNGRAGAYLLYPTVQEVDTDVAHYGKFPIPGQPGFGYFKFKRDTALFETNQLVHWKNKNNQHVYPLIIKEQITSTLISPDATRACIDVYSGRIFNWDYRDNREFVGSLNPDSEPESRIYDLSLGKELPVRIHPYKCIRWIDKSTLLISNGKQEARYYSFDIFSHKMTYLLGTE